jgi:hypothetical protein
MPLPLAALADRVLAAARPGRRTQPLSAQLLADRLAPYTVGARLDQVRTRYGSS